MKSKFSLPHPHLDVSELVHLYAELPSLKVLNVLSPEAYANAHLPDSLNVCVYAVSFGDEVRSLINDLATPIVVYGQSDQTIESYRACEKLQALGYTNVTRLSGGIDAWRKGGQAIHFLPPQPSIQLSTYSLDLASSVIHWTGRNRFNHHTGTISLATGLLKMVNGQPTRAEIIIDMTSIACTDISDPQANAGLIAHLRHDDFFAVNEYPTGEFVLTKARPIPDCTDGTPTHFISGDLTLRGITASIDFEATIDQRPNGGWGIQALFPIDRTRWNILYGSGRFFAQLGHHLVSDHIHLHLKIFTAQG